ncbi:hypothetical protein NQ317_003294 [Molorchus minor]|uniref:Uncharacterized protein n=1 Tax=Molorchus minor TaxID=1323400 RepID=A0ABQ9J605_9CUCU|nr:hypothetical protein NQ317_003294 [Molorchus minor]
MFSQHWPITTCTKWEEAKQTNTCNLPKDKSLWTIHGIWPTKNGTSGPQSCPSAIHFDPDQLVPMLNDLQTYWVNIEANTEPNSFWKHEWDKHGTCASVLPTLDSVTNYFQQGLTWNKQYKLSDMLEKSNIVPGSEGYTVKTIYDAVKSVTAKVPLIQCVVDEETQDSMISEIRICFDKSFDLIDCDPENPLSGTKLKAITNCNLKKPIMYLKDVPANEVSYEMDYDDAFRQHIDEQLFYMDIYRCLKFLIWLTT